MSQIKITRDTILITDAVLNEIMQASAKAYKCSIHEVMIAYTVDAKFMLFVNGEVKAMFDKESYDLANNVQSGIIIPKRAN